MATELEPVVGRLFEDFDSLNFGAIGKYTTKDAQRAPSLGTALAQASR